MRYPTIAVCRIALIGLLVSASLYGQEDGLCKRDPLPIDYVTVEDVYSPECGDGSNPFIKNARRVERVRDGITVCGLPSYDRIGARVAEFISCEAVHSEKCAARLDGLPNAIVLRTPAECEKRTLPNEFRAICCEHPIFEIAPAETDSYVIALFTSAKCLPHPLSLEGPCVKTEGQLPNASLIRRIDAHDSLVLAVCALPNNIRSNDAIVRRFHSANCPESPPVAGGPEGLNSWMILHNPPAGTLTLCAAAHKSDPKPLGPGYFGYRAVTKYSELCGGQVGKANSFEMRFPVSPNPFVR
jgi:hypothetical protein